jgi:hypothetical protein
MMYREMRHGLAMALLLLASCTPEPPSSGSGEGRPVAAPFVEILCTEDGETRLWTPVVEVQPDGVHVDVENRAGEPTSFFGLGTLEVGKGRHREVISEPPGRTRVACYPHSRHEKDAKPVRYELQLIDPQNHWVPLELECDTNLVEGTTLDYATPLPPGESRDPVEVTRQTVKGIQPDDRVEIAGYPEADDAKVSVVRDDTVIGVFSFLESEDGGLAIEGGESCASAGLGW